jgi:hypothetical protein
MSDEPSSRGILFSAAGTRYVAAAVAAAERSLRFNDVPHLIFCSEPPAVATRAGIELFTPSTNPHADKISTMLRSPFVETIYLDVDCAVIEPITELFDLLQRFDLAAAHPPGYRGAADPVVPSAFYEINTGVVAYRNDARIRELFTKWRTTYLDWLAAPPFPGADGLAAGQDQPAFRRCVWESEIAINILGPEYNWRPIFPSFLCARAKIIHAFRDDYDGLATMINAETGPRVFPDLRSIDRDKADAADAPVEYFGFEESHEGG